MNERIKSYIYCNFIPKGNIMTGGNKPGHITPLPIKALTLY